MKAEKTPTCYIIAGPNGAGKTTFALKYLPQFAQCTTFINADEIARGLSPLDVESAQHQAARLFLTSVKSHINERNTFAFETTLSGRTYFPSIKHWKEQGWKIVLYYLYLPNIEFSKARVKFRVSHGGHDISVDVIERRYLRSLTNLFDFMSLCDETWCFDNTRVPRLIFTQYNSRLHIHNQRRYDELCRKVISHG